MKIGRKKKHPPKVPVNAMSDIAFLLLIFIMVISLLNYRKVEKIDYPEAEYQETTQADQNFEIWIKKDGTRLFNGKTVDDQTLQALIAEAFVDHPKTRVHVIADKNTPYKQVHSVVEILKLLQHRAVSFVVKDNTK